MAPSTRSRSRLSAAGCAAPSPAAARSGSTRRWSRLDLLRAADRGAEIRSSELRFVADRAADGGAEINRRARSKRLVLHVEHEDVRLHRRLRLEDMRGVRQGGAAVVAPTEERILGREVEAQPVLDTPQAAQPAHRQDGRVAQPSLRAEDAEGHRHALARDVLGDRRPARVTALPEDAAPRSDAFPEDGLGTADAGADLVLGALTREAVVQKELLAEHEHRRARGLPATRSLELFTYVKAEAPQSRHLYRPANR
eukprot:scaffold21281_cov64-Phaeocystis_antarctica.AAC.3